MDELILGNTEKMENLRDQLQQKDASNPTAGHEVQSSLSEEIFDNNSQDFKTPLPPSPWHKSHLAWGQNLCDSGIGTLPRGASSCRSSSVSSNVLSSPQSSSSARGRRITLGTCEFSPVTRESFSVLRSRKLDFHSAENLVVSSQLQFVEEDHRNEESLSEGSEIQEETVSAEGGNNSLSPVSPGLFTFENISTSSQRRSVSPEDLELCMQDMSLEESSSSSLSSSLSLSSRSGSTSPQTHLTIEKNFTLSKKELNSISNSLQTSTSTLVKTDVIDWVTEISDTSTTSKTTDVPSSSNKTNFMTALHLASISTSAIPLSSFSSSESLMSISSHSHQSQTVSSSNSQSTPDTPLHQPQVFPPENSVKAQLLDISPESLPSAAHASKSPFKRMGADKSDFDYLLSPSKLRKMEECSQQSPSKSAVRRIFEDDSNHVSEPNLDSSQSNLALNLDNSKPLCFCECASKTQHDSNHQNEPKQSLCPCIPRTLQKVLQMSMPSAPSRLIGRNIGVAKLDIIGSLHQNFHLCVAKIFSFLLAEDLISVFKVSRAWRLALETDSLSFYRYQDYLRESARRRRVLTCSGKENAVDKDPDIPEPKPMTESKGLFSNLQFQASPKSVEQTPLKPKSKSCNHPVVQWGDELRHCPACQHPALVRPHQGRAVCMKESCGFDFCTQCFAAYHHPKPCKPLNRSVSKKDVAGSLKSKKSLKRL